MDTKQLIAGALIAAVGYLLREVRQDFRTLVKSVQELTVQIAVVIERLETHEVRIKNLENVEEK